MCPSSPFVGAFHVRYVLSLPPSPQVRPSFAPPSSQVRLPWGRTRGICGACFLPAGLVPLPRRAYLAYSFVGVKNVYKLEPPAFFSNFHSLGTRCSAAFVGLFFCFPLPELMVSFSFPFFPRPFPLIKYIIMCISPLRFSSHFRNSFRNLLFFNRDCKNFHFSAKKELLAFGHYV